MRDGKEEEEDERERGKEEGGVGCFLCQVSEDRL